MTATSQRNLRTLAAPGVAAVRHHWRPFVAIQGVALLLVLLFFFVPAVTRFCGTLAEFRVAGGYAAAMFATAVAGAILPELAKAATQRGWRLDRRTLADLGFLLPVFALNGLLVDAFYRLMAGTVGSGQRLADGAAQGRGRPTALHAVHLAAAGGDALHLASACGSTRGRLPATLAPRGMPAASSRCCCRAGRSGGQWCC